MGKKFGISFSWKRALGISGIKNRISRQIGIPLTKSGRDQKFGRYFTSVFFMPIKSNSSCRISKNKLEKYEFLKNINERMNIAFSRYLINKGIYFSNLEDYKKVKIDVSDENIEKNAEIKRALLEYQENVRLVNDGGNLTSKRKDIFLNSIYKIEDNCDLNSLNIKIFNNYKKVKEINDFYYSTLIIFIILSLILSFGFDNIELNIKILIGICFTLIFILLIFLLKYNNKKVKSLQEDIKKNFNIFYSNIKKTPTINI